MHLPDGILDTRTALLSTGAAVIGLSIALKQVRSLEPRRIPMLGLGGAFVFAAQMLNFPVIGGTSGHIIGGVLTAILLGPGAAVVVMSCVLIVQALMFADGGVLALGANIFNMAIVGGCGGYLVFRMARRFAPGDLNRSTVFASAFAGWCGTVLASVSCAGQLAWSGTAPWNVAFPAMANIHMLIGIGEGLATGLVVLSVLKVRPDLVAGVSHEPHANSPAFGFAVLIITGLALFIAPFACPWPDGFETVADRLGFEHKGIPGTGPMPDYTLPIVGSATLGTVVAGVVGTVLVYFLAYLLARILVPALRSPKDVCAGR